MLSWKRKNRSIYHGLKQLTRFVLFGTLLVDVFAFIPVSKSSIPSAGNPFLDTSSVSKIRGKGDGNNQQNRRLPDSASSTSLNVLLDVPDYFFTFSFPLLGILLSVSKDFARLRLEESAWEQRLEEAREKRLRSDPTLTELELRRKEASLEWSAYGKPRQEELEQQRMMREREEGFSSRSRRGVKVMENDDSYDENLESRNYQMTDDEINQFEMEYGIEYDPYYDDPYAEDELPDDFDFKVDKKYGDRIYENGEIFYKDKESGLFYRQGAKPRNLSFFGK